MFGHPICLPPIQIMEKIELIRRWLAYGKIRGRLRLVVIVNIDRRGAT